jgi:hypothetical protein
MLIYGAAWELAWQRHAESGHDPSDDELPGFVARAVNQVAPTAPWDQQIKMAERVEAYIPELVELHASQSHAGQHVVMTPSVLFGSASDEWSTAPELFASLTGCFSLSWTLAPRPRMRRAPDTSPKRLTGSNRIGEPIVCSAIPRIDHDRSRRRRADRGNGGRLAERFTCHPGVHNPNGDPWQRSSIIISWAVNLEIENGARYGKMVQSDQRLRIHSAAGRRQGRVCPYFGCRARWTEHAQ